MRGDPKVRLTVRIDPKLMEALEWCAAEDDRDVSPFVERLLAQVAQEKGWYKPPERPRTYAVPRKTRL